jgi:deoxyribodipyrimidine photo-lyase
MSRDQRIRDNHAISHAALLAQQSSAELEVVFCLADEFLGAARTQFSFMLQGLQEVAQSLSSLGITFHLLKGEGRAVGRLARELGASVVVCDFDPLRIKGEWRSAMMAECDCTVIEVDAHNIVPCWAASPKKEWAAATFRPKLKALLPSYIEHMPKPLDKKMLKRRSVKEDGSQEMLERALSGSGTNERYPPAGEDAAAKMLESFLRERLEGYSLARNDPNEDGQSGLSPYLHFGQLSAQRVALQVMAAPAPAFDKGAFLEELTVRRELADNFCHYEKGYDSTDCFPAWAKASLAEHLGDRREYLYTVDELERARTHDPLWNAAQLQMTREGKMHGYLRMYWAKKILEWTASPEDAMHAAIVLNDRYELDGRDPNGYAGIAWSIGGVHDRAWPARPIFGKVRYMSLGGSRSKFDVDRFNGRYQN